MASSGLIYRPEVDGLRAIAVGAVLLNHMGLNFVSGGFVGVDVFFVISGYLIGTIILTEVQQNRFSLVRFYERRARRILPALFVVLVVSSISAFFFMLPYQQIAFGQNLLGTAAFVSNVTLMLQGGYFGGPGELNPLLHTWSLAVEEQFYLVFPLLALMLRRWIRGWPFVAVIALLSLASFAIAEWASLHHPTAGFFLIVTRAWELGFGVLVAIALARGLRWSQGVAGWVALGGLSAILFSTYSFNDATPFPGVNALLPVMGAAAVILCAGPQNLVGRILSLPPFVGSGLISYSLYLWHQPLFAFARLVAPDLSKGNWLIGAMGVLSGLLAWGTWRFVEQPFRTTGGFSRSAIFGLGAAGIALSFALGAGFVLSRGFLFLYREDQRKLASVVPIEELAYVSAAYESLSQNLPVVPEEKTVLLIGDSFSQDFYNMLRETGAFAQYKVASRYISSKCQIQLVPPSNADGAEAKNAKFCASGIANLTSAIIAQSRDADIVILSGSWVPWSAARVSETVAAFGRTTGKDLFIIGTKDFGTIDFRNLMNMKPQALIDHRAATEPRRRETNETMKATLPADAFIDLFSIYCSQDYLCPQFDPNGNLLSVDGSHLTRAGAQFLGRRVFAHPALGRFASPQTDNQKMENNDQEP
jgi:peptidoglycan/LPS O-acetylase OafA/YrhL